MVPATYCAYQANRETLESHNSIHIREMHDGIGGSGLFIVKRSTKTPYLHVNATSRDMALVETITQVMSTLLRDDIFACAVCRLWTDSDRVSSSGYAGV